MLAQPFTELWDPEHLSASVFSLVKWRSHYLTLKMAEYSRGKYIHTHTLLKLPTKAESVKHKV